jgi:hypothetical protein
MCPISAATIAADGQDVGQAIEQIAAEPGLPANVAADLESAGEGIIAATANWKQGSTTDALEDAEGIAIAAINLIPLTAPYAGAVAIAFAALNLLFANTSTQPAQAGASSSFAKALIVAHAANANRTNSQWFGKAEIPHNGDFRKGLKDAWAAYAAAHPDQGFKPLTA